MLPNKITIVMQVLAYLVIIVATAIQFIYFYSKTTNLKGREISIICIDVTYFFGNLIFGLIVNTIVTKIEIAT